MAQGFVYYVVCLVHQIGLTGIVIGAQQFSQHVQSKAKAQRDTTKAALTAERCIGRFDGWENTRRQKSEVPRWEDNLMESRT